MARIPRPLPAPLSSRVFTRAEARELGVPPSRLRRKDLRRLGSGLYVAAGCRVTELEMASAVTWGRPELVVSGASAARIWDFPLPAELEAGSDEDAAARRLEVTVPRSGLRPTTSGLRVRTASLPSAAVRFLGDVPITTRTQTWVDLAGRLTDLQLTAIGDHFVRRPRPGLEGGRTGPWASLQELRMVVERNAGRPGIVQMRRVLDRVRVGADSPMETELRLALEDAGLPEAQLNLPLLGPRGESLHEPDLQWPTWRVACEYEGAGHRTAAQMRRDIDRAERLRRIGWIEVRVMIDHMHRGAEIAIDRVSRALRDHGWPG
ncbi:hypothetical protein [Brachybacterium hainanense]|uniref:DUF559 domain-containing protein n=1 Tax=Brachybacterium hainanense TaxID=1541174 RepID=A0ABV6RAY5_9MICO